jgi:hypothetical protein
MFKEDIEKEMVVQGVSEVFHKYSFPTHKPNHIHALQILGKYKCSSDGTFHSTTCAQLVRLLYLIKTDIW